MCSDCFIPESIKKGINLIIRTLGNISFEAIKFERLDESVFAFNISLA